MLALIRQNLVDLKATYGDARRTQITDQARGALTVHDVLPEEDVWVTVRSDGTVGRAAGRLPAGSRRAAVRARGKHPLRPVPDQPAGPGDADRRSPAARRRGRESLWTWAGCARGDHIAAAFTAQKPNGEPVEGYLVLATARGAVKRINLADLAAAAQANPNVIKLDEDDTSRGPSPSSGGGEIMLVTAGGQVIRFCRR